MGSLWKGLLQNSLLLAGLKAFAASLILTPILRDVFRSYNVVDRPGHRRLHAHPIPRIGGVAIAAAYVIAVFPLDQLSLWRLLPGAAVIFLTGLVDDFFTLKPIFKLAGQTAAALLVFYNGLSVGSLGGNATLPLWLDLPVTVLWVLLTTNALNLIDGLDGLCAGIGSIAALAMFGANQKDALGKKSSDFAMTTIREDGRETIVAGAGADLSGRDAGEQIAVNYL